MQDTTKKLVKTHCIALTGAIATGKSTVAEILRRTSYLVWDADQLSRQVVQPGSMTLDTLASTFGSEILTDQKHLDRAALRKIILSNPRAKESLEAILHPAIEEEFLSQVSRSSLPSAPKVFFYEAALIFERQRQNDFRESWCTWCPVDEQVSRLIARTHPAIAASEAQALINAQWSADRKAKLADRVISTEGNLQETERRVLQALSQLP